MGIPSRVYLRTVSGEPIGPIPAEAISALVEAEVIHPGTPASLDGRTFVCLSRLDETKGAPPETLTIDLGITVLRGMLARAVERASGHVRVQAHQGEITVTLKDGKVVGVETTVPSLSLAAHLKSGGLVSASAIAAAEARAPSVGNDLGAALISAGDIPPHTYLEQLVAWSMKVLATALLEQHPKTLFEPALVPTPMVPIALDQFGVYLEAVRAFTNRRDLDRCVEPHMASPVVLSAVDGLSLDACKLKPRELRVMNSVNGVRTVEDIVGELGTSDESTLSVLQVLFFAEQAGFIVYGEDPRLAAERDEARRLGARLTELKSMNYLQVLGVTEKSTDEEVRAKYTEFAKRYHPDRTRQGALPELIEIHRAIFQLAKDAFEALEHENARFAYAQDVERGVAGGTDDLRRVQDVLRSETLFKKAEILVRVRKYSEALQHLDEAIALNPDDVEFRVCRHYVDFLATPQAQRTPELAKARIRPMAQLMEKSPNIANGHLWMGHLHKHAGHAEAALRCFERVLEFDPNQPEALQEVRLAELRRSKQKGGAKPGSAPARGKR